MDSSWCLPSRARFQNWASTDGLRKKELIFPAINVNDGVEKVSSSGKRWLVVDDEFLFLVLKANIALTKSSFKLTETVVNGDLHFTAINVNNGVDEVFKLKEMVPVAWALVPLLTCRLC